MNRTLKVKWVLSGVRGDGVPGLIALWHLDEADEVQQGDKGTREPHSPISLARSKLAYRGQPRAVWCPE
jgi:hypothetical protein